MSRKYLITSIVCAVVLGAIALFSGWYVWRQAGLNRRGQYVFAEAKENVQDIQHIRMTTAANGEINIYLKDGVWRFKEAANYFINPEMLAAFYFMVNNSIIMSASEGGKEEFKKDALMLPTEEAKPEETGTFVELFDGAEKSLGAAVIGNNSGSEEYRFARLLEYPFVYTISSVRNFSGEAGAWVPFPLLQIPGKNIQKLVFDRIPLRKEAIEAYLSRSIWLQKLLGTLSYVGYTGITYRQDFENDFPEIKPHELKVETDIGLVYVFQIYNIGADEYWLGVRLATTKIPRKDVGAFVAENQKYFSEWLFNLDAEQGKLLYESKAADLIDSFKLQ